MTGLLAEPPREALPPPRRVFTKKQLAFRYLWIAALIMAGSMFALWALSPVWDPFHVERQGTFEAYGDALPWIAGVVLLVQAVVAMVDRARRGEPMIPEEPPPPPIEGEAEDLQPVGTWLRSLARFLAIGCAILAVVTGVIGFSCATQQPSEILGTDPQGTAEAGFLMAGGFALAAILLWWAGRDR